MSTWQKVHSLVRVFGWAQGLRFAFWRYLAKGLGENRRLRFAPAGSLVPLLCRGGTSDLMVLKQVFVDGQYSRLQSQQGVEWILDCGANGGYSAAWLLSAFPGARLLAIEPEVANFALLCANTAPFGEKIVCLQGAIWSSSDWLELGTPEGPGPAQWRYTTRPIQDGRKSRNLTKSYTLDELLDRFEISRLSILKMDIEGAEVEVLLGQDPRWLTRVDCLAIELHDALGPPNLRERFAELMASKGFNSTVEGEIVFSFRRGAHA